MAVLEAKGWKRSILAGLLALAGLPWLLSSYCQAEGRPETGPVRVACEPLFRPIVEAWSTGLRIPVEVVEESGPYVLQHVAGDKAEFGLVAGLLLPSHKALLAARRGRRGRSDLVGYVAAQVLVNPINPLESISRQHFGRLFQAPGCGPDEPLRGWGELVPMLADDIELVVSQAAAPVLPTVLGQDCELPEAISFHGSEPAVERHCAREPWALGVTLGLRHVQAARAVPVSATPDSQPVLPEPSACREGTYPLVQPLYLVSNRPYPSHHPAERLRVFALSSAGQYHLARAGFVAAKEFGAPPEQEFPVEGE